MTSDRDLKVLIRARAAKTGESYQTARRRLLGEHGVPGLSSEDRRAVEEYFPAWWAALAEFQKRGRPFAEFEGVAVPVAAMQAAALAHPDPKVRRECLGVLDHKANDESMPVFCRALHDPVPRVRLIALHALSCQRCKAHPLCDYDLVPDLVDLLAGDPSPKIRHALVGVLARLVDDPRVRASLEQTSLGDPDAMVRQVASAALRGDRRAVRSRKSIRRHAKGLEVSATSKGVS